MNDLNLDTTNVCFTNIIYDIDSIINKIKTSTNIDEIKNIIKVQHNTIFKYDNFINNNREGVQDLFTSTLFLDALDSVSGIILPELLESEIVFINKIIYDYFEFSNGYDSDIKEKMLCISYTINSFRIKALSSFIGIKLARLLSVISYSSYKIEKIVHRVNNFIMNNNFDSEIIKNIYYIIFGGKMIDYTVNDKYVNLFCYSMIEYCDKNDPEIINKFHEISSYLLNELIVCSICYNETAYRILSVYSNMISLMNIDKSKLRFSIKEELNKIKEKDKLRNLYDIINYIESTTNNIIY